MALHLLKNPALVPELAYADSHYARVEATPRTGLRRFFGPRPGSVRPAPGCDPENPTIQVVPPVWKNGMKEERECLQQCYQSVLQYAAQHSCRAVVLPLLAAEDPDFPAYIDFKIAVDTVQAFLLLHTMDVFLIVTRQKAFQMPELRNDVELFLHRNYFEEPLPWSSAPFAEDADRFDTLVPPFALIPEPVLDSGWETPTFDWDTDLLPPDLPPETEVPPPWGEIVCYDARQDSCQEVLAGASFEAPPQPAPAASKKASWADTGILPSKSELEAMLRATDAGFSETLLNLIDKSGKKDSEVYNKANVSRQHFSKIRNNPNYKPTKPTAIAFAIALELDMDQTRDLIGRAGYTLTNSSKFDVIIMYFIQKRIYNMFDINEMLYEFDQSLLGA